MAKKPDNKGLTKKSSEQTHKSAIALQYNPGEIPFVCAAGTKEIAEAILSSAQSLQIPIFENEALLCSLAALELGEEIPRELYLIIAQILAFVYHLKGLSPTNNTPDAEHKL